MPGAPARGASKRRSVAAARRGFEALAWRLGAPQPAAQGTSVGTAGASAPRAVPSSARTTGSPGRPPCEVRAPGHTDCTVRLRAPSRRAESGGTTTSSASDQTETNRGPSGVSSRAFRARSRSLSGSSWRQAVGHRPATPDRELGDRGAVLRGADAEHPPGLAGAVGVPDPLAGHHAAGRVADDVHRAGVEPLHGVVRDPVEGLRLLGDVAGPAADRRHHDDVASGAGQGLAHRVEGTGGAAVPADQQDRARARPGPPGPRRR